MIFLKKDLPKKGIVAMGHPSKNRGASVFFGSSFGGFFVYFFVSCSLHTLSVCNRNRLKVKVKGGHF